MNDLNVCVCKKALTITELLDAATHYDAGLEIVIVKCPACAAQSEVRVSNGAIGLGYVYAAGSAHFAEMERVDVPGLAVSVAGTSLVVTFGKRTWTI